MNTDCCQSMKSVTKDKYFTSFAFLWEETSEFRDKCLMQSFIWKLWFYKCYNMYITHNYSNTSIVSLCFFLFFLHINLAVFRCPQRLPVSDT